MKIVKFNTTGSASDDNMEDAEFELVNPPRSESVDISEQLKPLNHPEMDLPEIWVAGDERNLLNISAVKIGRLFRKTRRVRRRPQGEAIEIVLGKAETRSLDKTRLIVLLHQVATPVKVKVKDGERKTTPQICTSTFANLILQHEAFLAELEPVEIAVPRPLLAEDRGELVIVAKGNTINGIYAEGDPPLIPDDLNEAVSILLEPLCDYNFATPADKSRAIAAMIAPLLAMAQLFDGRVPLLLAEADLSQSGKGFIFRIIREIYGQDAAVVHSNKGGVGSIGEAIDTALVAGKIFIQGDNLKGHADCEKLESLATEPTYSARPAYSKVVEIKPHRNIIMLTTNSLTMSEDLSNRILPIHIRKQPMSYKFKHYPEGNILQHIKANQSKYLGAVMKVVMTWHELGRPFNEDARTKHNFREFAGIAEYLVHDLMGQPSMFDGIEAIRTRMFTPEMGWIRDIGQVVSEAGKLDQKLSAKDILQLLEKEERYDLQPGVKDHESIENDTCMKRALIQLGKQAGKLFKNGPEVSIEGIKVTRTSEMIPRPDGNGCRSTKCYSFEKIDAA